MDMLINVDSNGSVSGLHFDAFDLGFLGMKRVRRASEIFFNEQTQLWDVLIPGQQEVYPSAAGFACYEDARDFEIEWLQLCARKQVSPLDPGGAKAARVVRGEHFM